MPAARERSSPDTETTGSNWENRPGDFATPTQNNQQSAPYPGVGGKPAPVGGGGACPCGNSYSCSVTLSGQTTTQTISLGASTGGQCTAVDDDDDDKTVVTCDGQLLVKDTPVGSWTGNASQFTITSTDGKQVVSLTCVKIATLAPVAATTSPSTMLRPFPRWTTAVPPDAG